MFIEFSSAKFRIIEYILSFVTQKSQCKISFLKNYRKENLRFLAFEIQIRADCFSFRRSSLAIASRSSNKSIETLVNTC